LGIDPEMWLKYLNDIFIYYFLLNEKDFVDPEKLYSKSAQ